MDRGTGLGGRRGNGRRYQWVRPRESGIFRREFCRRDDVSLSLKGSGLDWLVPHESLQSRTMRATAHTKWPRFRRGIRTKREIHGSAIRGRTRKRLKKVVSLPIDERFALGTACAHWARAPAGRAQPYGSPSRAGDRSSIGHVLCSVPQKHRRKSFVFSMSSGLGTGPWSCWTIWALLHVGRKAHRQTTPDMAMFGPAPILVSFLNITHSNRSTVRVSGHITRDCRGDCRSDHERTWS